MQSNDLDDLLDLVEEKFVTGDVSPPVLSIRSTTRSSAHTATTEDLEQLLIDLETPNSVTPLPSKEPPKVSLDKVKKCWPPYISGTTDSDPTCLHLRCLKCDCTVVSFSKWSWRQDVDYLFLRTNYPSFDLLKSKMEPRASARAYCCQCQRVTASERMAVSSASSAKGVQSWVCSGK